MTSLGECLREPPAAAERPAATVRAEVLSPAPRPASLHQEQIHTLVQNLFFGYASAPVRNVGFAPADPPTQASALCFEAARVLAAAGQYDVGLFDATSTKASLPEALQIAPPANVDEPWPLARRLWLIPRQSWLPESALHEPADQNFERLRELMADFDFSILHCAPFSWLTARVARVCDGLVLVLTANKTRRIIAAQLKDRIGKLHVPLLGSVLIERRFPVPEGLYRSL